MNYFGLDHEFYTPNIVDERRAARVTSNPLFPRYYPELEMVIHAHCDDADNPDVRDCWEITRVEYDYPPEWQLREVSDYHYLLAEESFDTAFGAYFTDFWQLLR